MVRQILCKIEEAERIDRLHAEFYTTIVLRPHSRVYINRKWFENRHNLPIRIMQEVEISILFEGLVEVRRPWFESVYKSGE